jgi:hypothetical protein
MTSIPAGEGTARSPEGLSPLSVSANSSWNLDDQLGLSGVPIRSC